MNVEILKQKYGELLYEYDLLLAKNRIIRKKDFSRVCEFKSIDEEYIFAKGSTKREKEIINNLYSIACDSTERYLKEVI